MKIARRVPWAIFGAAVCQTRRLCGSSATESGSTSPKMMISLPVILSRRKNAELSTVAMAGPEIAGRRGERAGE